jgi:molecular chaperone GrpE
MSKHKSQQEKEDIVYEDNNDPSFGRDITKQIEKLKKELIKCKEEKQEYLDGWQRSKADFVNLKKRNAEDISNLKNVFLVDFINDLLPVLDSFDMAFKDKQSWESAPEQWRKGIEYIHNQLQNLLNNHNIEVVDPLGEEFNHDEHHSVESVDIEDEKEDGKVVEVVLKGYKTKDFLIRAVSVKVGILKK